MTRGSLDLATARIAVVHPFFLSRGGGEKLIDALAGLFPRAEFFTMMLDRASVSPVMRGRTIHSTFLDHVPARRRFYQHLSPLYDLATHRHDLSGFDIVISSGGPGAKTARVGRQALHIHYCHSPVRYLWDQYETWMARLPVPLRPVFALTAARQRRRDYAAAQRVDAFVSNSDYIGQRIARYYGQPSRTIYPPVALCRNEPASERGDYYLTVGRLVPGKRTDLLIEACNRLKRRLIVVGGGPEQAAMRALAGPMVEVTGRVNDTELHAFFRHARAFLFAADEDFGIVTAEAQGHGLPAIAFGHGGSLEILAEGDAHAPGDAVFFREQTVAAVIAAIERFEAVEHRFDGRTIQARAARFSQARFDKEFLSFLTQAWQAKYADGKGGAPDTGAPVAQAD